VSGSIPTKSYVTSGGKGRDGGKDRTVQPRSLERRLPNRLKTQVKEHTWQRQQRGHAKKERTPQAVSTPRGVHPIKSKQVAHSNRQSQPNKQPSHPSQQHVVNRFVHAWEACRDL
jgi:predicted ribosome quality control (RQC) complex YloA/Tae2 family protein